MSEYTPTTEEVKKRFVQYPYFANDTSMEIPATFDRWLAEVVREAKEKAYERGRLDERHDCERYGEYERGEITGPQLRDNLRKLYPYRRNEGENE